MIDGVNKAIAVVTMANTPFWIELVMLKIQDSSD